jgi:hypothetical protein
MIKRLIDDPGVEASERRLADLLRAAAPYEVDPFRKRRVLVSLSRVEGRSVSRFWLRPAGIALLLVSGTATAAIGHRYVAHGSGFFGLGSAAPAARTVKPVATPVAPATLATANTAPRANADSANSADTAATAEIAAATDATETPPSAVHGASKSASHARPDSSEDATHVAEAIQALRADKDPSRAQGLLNDYLKTHPNGVLSEDALALSIEAASAQHDPKAADYARRYLAKFPHGKYRDLANRAIAR